MRQRPVPGADLALVRDRAESPLRRLDGAHLLITGASGLIGSWLLETLLDARHHFGIEVSATALVRDEATFRVRYPHLAASSCITIQQGDVRNCAAPVRAPTHIIHAASADSPARNVEATDDVINVIEAGTAHIVAIAQQVDAARVLLLSSGSVYSAQPRPISETDDTGNRGTSIAEQFGAAKRRAEQHAEASSAVRGVTVARIFTLFGPRLPINGQFAIGQFLGDALEGQPVRVHGDGTPIRSYLYLADLAAWCWHLLDRGGSVRTFNVGASQQISIGDVATRVGDLAGVRIIVETPPESGARPPCYLPAVERAQTELGLDAWTSLDDGLARTWAWLRGGT